MTQASSTPRVLVLALSNWIGAPRLPSALRRAGFHVTSFAFSGLLMQRSQSIDEAILVPESIDNDGLFDAFLAAIERARPDIVIPTDDATILLLHAAYHLAQRPGGAERTRAVLQASVGEVRHLPTTRNRKLLAALAQSTGVRAPEQAALFSPQEARAFAAAHGYPVVLKEEDSVAGFGVSICKLESELEQALARIQKKPAGFEQGVLAQTFVEGRPAMRVVVAQRGRVLGGLSAIKLETWPSAQGPSTCVELVEHREMEATAETLIAKLGYNGFASFDFMLDRSGQAHLIELNPRPTPIAHLGERFGACLCRQLYAALSGESSGASEPRGLPTRVALFPQEWVRDPKSPHLAAGVYHDVPWEEPDLVEAYVSFARGQMRYNAYGALFARNEVLRARLEKLEKEAAT
jgi:biotin carboxylase